MRAFLPLVLALPAALLLPVVARRVTPPLSMRLLATGIASLFVAVFVTSAIIGIGMIPHYPIGDRLVVWCSHALPHGGATLWASGFVSALALWWTARMILVAREWFRFRGVGASRVHLVETPEPLAFAQTGRNGGIVVSTGMLDLLDETEQTVLLAHEQAHLDQRHDRYLVIAALGASVPPLRPAAGALRHAVERCADEFAARAVGDRTVVARALAKVAVTRHDRAALAPAITGANLRARIDALLAPGATGEGTTPYATLAVTALAVTAISAVVQTHHSVEMLLALCPW